MKGIKNVGIKINYMKDMLRTYLHENERININGRSFYVQRFYSDYILMKREGYNPLGQHYSINECFDYFDVYTRLYGGNNE